LELCPVLDELVRNAFNTELNTFLRLTQKIFEPFSDFLLSQAQGENHQTRVAAV